MARLRFWRKKLYGDLHGMPVGGRFVNPWGYVIVRVDRDHPLVGHQKKDRDRLIDDPQFVREHRLIMAEHLGRKLTKDEQVHHKNRNRRDNRLENLQVVTADEHKAIHKALRESKT